MGCLLTALAGVASASLCSRVFVPDENALVLIAIGGVGAVCNTGGFQILTRYKDLLSTKGLNEWHQNRMEQRLSSRLPRTVGKWIACYLAAVVTIIVGNLVRTRKQETFVLIATYAGYVSAAAVVALFGMLLLEFIALVRLWNAIRRDFLEEEQQQDFYRKLRS